MLRIRVDVDYPYPSRFRSFVYTAFGLNMGSDYLKNSKLIAKMINSSPKEVKTYWFFTPKTFPDKELFVLLDNSRHEIGLHIANDPYGELDLLKRATGKKVNYYTIHGTARLFARAMWGRFRTSVPMIPQGYPLESFYQFPTFGLDLLCHRYTAEQCLAIAQKGIRNGNVMHIHPIWLFQRGKLNRRGPYFDVLRWVLDVDKEFDTLVVRRKAFFEIANNSKEYERDVMPNDQFLEKLRGKKIDVFTFLERKWCNTIKNPPKSWLRATDNIALLQTPRFEEWWKDIGKKTRNMIRKAEKSGVRTEVAKPSDKLAEGIWQIYNETPIRQERAFPHYGITLENVKTMLRKSQNSTYVAAYLLDELAGFIQLVHGDRITIIAQILSLQRHWDKAVNNALVAKAIEFCACNNVQWIMYGRMGNHPSLDNFKQNNGFTRFQLTRYYIPLTRKGKMTIGLGLHREIKDVLPQTVKYPLLPLYNWISRTKTRIKTKLRPKQRFSLSNVSSEST